MAVGGRDARAASPLGVDRRWNRSPLARHRRGPQRAGIPYRLTRASTSALAAAGIVDGAFDAGVPGAVRAAIDVISILDAVPDHMTPAVRALRRDPVDRA